MKKATHSLFLVVIASAMLLPVVVSQHGSLGEREANKIRGLLDLASGSASSPEASATPATTAPAATSSNTPSTTPAQTTPAGAATSAASPSSAVHATSTHASSQLPSSTTAAPATSVVPSTSTDPAGNIITISVTSTPSASSSAPSHTAGSNNSSSGLSTGSIIGLSVAGGVAALGIILFFVWKFTRKRFGDFDDNEAIKWPELNAHNNDVHALPTNATGRAGFGPENDSDINLTRAPSPGGTYANSIAASVPDLYGTRDPYAVPPLPHLNPNQPYHDDPGAYSQPTGYYDPYRGPVPNTFDTISDGHGTEAIPMTRMRSPGPQMAYDVQGRASPAPQAVTGYAGVDERSRTPNLSTFDAGRASPGPHSGYGYGPR